MMFDDQVVKYEIWDTAGQERYHSLAPMYYRSTHAAVVVYDITDYVSIHYDNFVVTLMYAYASMYAMLYYVIALLSQKVIVTLICGHHRTIRSLCLCF